MDRDKLAELRKRKAENKAKLHKELLDSNASIKDAVEALSTAINSQEPVDLEKFIQEFKDSQTYGEDIKRFETALRESSDKEKLDEIIKAVGNINNVDVVTAVNNLIKNIENKAVDQRPEAFQPVRRVRKIGQRLVFDDDPLQVNVSAGGGGGGIQTTLTRNNNSIAVVNPDGTPITDKFNFNGLGQLEVDANFSGDIEIGDVQIENAGGTKINPSTEEKQDDTISAIGNIPLNILDTFNTNNIKTIGLVTYIGMENKDGAYCIKKIDSTTDNVFTYATITNNPTVLTYTLAWTGILTNTYSIYSGAF